MKWSLLVLSILAVSNLHASTISSSMFIKQVSGPGTNNEVQFNGTAAPGDIVKSERALVIDSCPLCVGTATKGTAKGATVTGLGSISAVADFEIQPFGGVNPGFGAVFSQSGEYLISDITIDYRGVDASGFVDQLGRVRADLHMTANVDILGRFNQNFTGLGIQATMNGYARGDTLRDTFLANEKLSFNNYLVPVNSTFDLKVNASASAIGSIAEGDKLVARSSWSIVLGGSPAFILPEGFFANSADGSIVDNYFVGNMPDVNEVPEPGAFSLIALGLLGIRLFRKQA